MIREEDIEQEIIKMASDNSLSIKEIRIIGSRASKEEGGKNQNKSDIDLFIFLGKEAFEDIIYEKLSLLTIQSGILIHPVLIKEEEKEMKLKIKEYNEAYLKGRTLFTR